MNQTLGCNCTHPRAASGQERGVLTILRALTPRRSVNYREALLLAELQANRLLELAGLTTAPIPTELITQLPRIVVRLDPDLAVSASARWMTGQWLLSVNSQDPWTKQRFSLGHELKHVIDHRHVNLYASDSEAEHAADYFAACLLMPKRLVLKAWNQGDRRLSTLAALFGVSRSAMAVRLEHLGLRQPEGARATPHGRPRSGGAHYESNATFLQGVVR
jgi:predicted transcriptional regulator